MFFEKVRDNIKCSWWVRYIAYVNVSNINIDNINFR